MGYDGQLLDLNSTGSLETENENNLCIRVQQIPGANSPWCLKLPMFHLVF
jgi:hypothetical protein